MTVSILFSTIFETALVGFGVWALFNEDKFIRFEEKLFSNIKRRRLRILKKSDNRKITSSKVIKITDFD